MIKLYTLNPEPSGATLLTPREGATQLTLTRPLPDFDGMPPRRFDGVIECASYPDLATAFAAHGVADAAGFTAKYPDNRWIFWENVIIPGDEPSGPGAVKLTSLFAHLDSMSREAFLEYYPTRHAPLVRKTPKLQRYVQNYRIAPGRGGRPRFDAIAELWWPDIDTAIESWMSPQIQMEQGADCLNFIFGDSSINVFGTNEVVA